MLWFESAAFVNDSDLWFTYAEIVVEDDWDKSVIFQLFMGGKTEDGMT